MMTTRGKSEGCRICGNDLQGNQRRWLYAGQNRKGAQPQTPTDFSSKGSLPRSAQSSPWGMNFRALFQQLTFVWYYCCL